MSKIKIKKIVHDPEPTSFQNIGDGEFFVITSDNDERIFMMVDGDEEFNAVEVRPEYSWKPVKQYSRYRTFKASDQVYVAKVNIEYSLI